MLEQFEILANMQYYDYKTYSEKLFSDQDFHPSMIGGRNVCYTRLFAGEIGLTSKPFKKTTPRYLTLNCFCNNISRLCTIFSHLAKIIC